MKTIGKHAVDCLTGKAAFGVAARSRAGLLLFIVSALSCCTLIAGQPDGPSVCQPEQPNAVPSDLERMQGNWRVTTSQVGDEQADPAEMARRRVIVKGDKLTYEYGNPQHEKREGTIKLDPATHAFDLFVPFENVTALAIYELKGDTLRIGFGNDGLIRPRIWHLGPQDVAWLLVLKREKPDARIELQMLEGTWQPTWVESGGVKAAAKDIEGFNQPTVIKDGKTTWRYENKDYDVAITVDPTESPKTIDRQAIGGDGLLKDLVSRAIYELAGDTLRICFNAEREEQRPKNFRSDETFVIVTFARKTD